jgi:hypothetical protein
MKAFVAAALLGVFALAQDTQRLKDALKADEIAAVFQGDSAYENATLARESYQIKSSGNTD